MNCRERADVTPRDGERIQELGADFTFVSRGEPGLEGADPLPMSEEDVARLAEGDYQGTAIWGGWTGQSKLTLREGNYVFLVSGPEGEQPGVQPTSMAVLEVLP